MRLIPVLILGLLVGCSENNIQSPTSPSPTTPTSPTTPATSTRIEYRVNGNALGVRVRYSNPVDGLTQVVTTLPYVATINTTADSLFLSLEATPTAYAFTTTFPFMSVQIFVNGQLFREATSSDYLLNTISVSGNWRK